MKFAGQKRPRRTGMNEVTQVMGNVKNRSAESLCYELWTQEDAVRNVHLLHITLPRLQVFTLISTLH
jgi:hypothetical protein